MIEPLFELASICPTCGYEHEVHLNADEEDDSAPGPGDISVCWNCTMISEYGHDDEGQLVLVPVSAARYNELMLDPEVQRFVVVAQAAKAGLI
jgi:hypothetical protein